jgi:hypothetical protein
MAPKIAIVYVRNFAVISLFTLDRIVPTDVTNAVLR